MNHNPLRTYNGLSIILDSPSRFDEHLLLSGYAGNAFCNFLRPLDRFSSHIFTSDYGLTNLKNDTQVCLLLGQKSLDLVSDSSHILSWRGSPIIKDGVIFVPTLSPQDAFDRREFEREETDEDKDYQRTQRKNFPFWLEHDTKKAIAILQRHHIIEYVKPKYYIYPPIEQAINTLLNSRDQFIVIDIECDYNRQLTCLGFSILGSNEIYVVPFQRYNRELSYDKSLLCKFIVALASAFSHNTIIGHNLSFDLFILAWKYRIPFPRKIRDTQSMHHRCYPEVEKSLGHCISLYLELPYHKDQHVIEPENILQEEQLWKYNGLDVWTTSLVYQELVKEGMKLGATSSQLQACASIVPYLTVTMQGMRINDTERPTIIDRCSRMEKQCERILKMVTHEDINPRSSRQVCEYLYDKLGIKRPLKDPTNKRELLKIYGKQNVPSIRIILAARANRKRASFLQFNLWNRRFTTSYLVDGTDTFRLSSRSLMEWKKARLEGYGTNAQNWDKNFRNIVIPDEGKVLVQIDQAGAEALIVAYLCKDGNFRKLFKLGIKSHVFVAMHLFAHIWAEKLGLKNIDDYLNAPIDSLRSLPYWKDLEKLIKDSDKESDNSKRYYFMAKTGCHASNYDIKAGNLQMTALVKSDGAVRMPIEFWEKFLILYNHRLFPEINDWRERTVDELQKNKRILRNLFGYPCVFTGYWDESLFKKAYAFKPQSTVGTITNIAVTEIQDKINVGTVDADILQNGHDSILLQTTMDKLSATVAVIRGAIERPLEVEGVKFNMRSEVTVGENWRDMKEYKL